MFEVSATNQSADAGYSVARSVREVLFSKYGGTTNIIKSTELSNNQASINAGVINVTLATIATVSGSDILLYGTPSLAGANNPTVAELSIMIDILSSAVPATLTTP